MDDRILWLCAGLLLGLLIHRIARWYENPSEPQDQWAMNFAKQCIESLRSSTDTTRIETALRDLSTQVTRMDETLFHLYAQVADKKLVTPIREIPAQRGETSPGMDAISNRASVALERDGLLEEDPAPPDSPETAASLDSGART